jgi:hypothetical protein
MHRHATGRLLFGLLLAVAAPAASEALACSCAPPNRADQVRNVSAIFVGEVVTAPDLPADRSSPGAGRLRYRFRVEESLKGAASGTVVVTTAASPAACGVTFRTGERYLVFARERDGLLETGLCDFDVAGAEIDAVRSEVRRALGP